MKLSTGIQSEWQKVKHTSFWIVHTIMPLAGALFFTFYFSLYGSVEAEAKLKLVLELTGMMFPLLTGVVVGLNIQLEERASHMQTLLSLPNRRRGFLAKLIVLYGTGVLSLFTLFVLFLVGTGLAGQWKEVLFMELLLSVVGLAWSSFVIYIMHFIFSLKFGLGFSLFWGIFESLQCIMYSNIELHGAARYIPFAWGMNWIHDVLNHTLLQNMAQWILNVGITICMLFAAMQWFTHWEGRKHEE